MILPPPPVLSRPSPNHNARPAGGAIDTLVLHYTGMRSCAAALDRLCDPVAKVSAHYLIDEDGAVHALVPEDRRAWHAGAAFWRGTRDVNGHSIGIELVNPGHEFGYRPFPEDQMKALVDLCADILARHPIAPRNVVGHSDVAPARKRDPGEKFDWPRLADRGIGLWPSSAAPQALPEGDIGAGEVLALLGAYGYDVEDGRAAIAAFQRHFRPTRVDGIADADTAGRLSALLRLAGQGPTLS